MILRVKEYMSASVMLAQPGDGLFETVSRMTDAGVRHVPVVNSNKELIGIVSDRDVRLAFPTESALPVSELMSRELVTVFPEDSLAYAIDLLVKHRFGALPVVDESNHPVGILSAIDVMEAIRTTVDIREGRGHTQRY